MTEDETPLHQIAWTRFKRQLGQPPSFEAEELLCQAMKPHLIATLRAALLSVAIVVLAARTHIEINTFTHWLREQLHWLSTYPILWASFGLLMAALFIPRLLSALVRLWQWNQRRKFLPFITLLPVIGLISFSDTHYASSSAWICGMVLFGLLFTQLKTTPVKTEHIHDSFQRTIFANLLMEKVFLKANTKLRRIAILGTWGTGKTIVLKLLREKLTQAKEKNFRIAWVNPWTTKTPEEALALIAQGFDHALGNAFSQTITPSTAPWSWFSSLKASLSHGLSVDFSRLIEGNAKATEKDFVERINQKLADRKVTVVLLVDDMERAEPEVIRRIFPVIDRLGAIDHCFFVFAIDPDRVTKAFGEKSRTAEETKGYLDKVFDLKFDLPDLRPQDIATWVKEDERINPTDTPKLHVAWDHIAADLPTNPREALHFINDAITREVMFLSRHADDEHNYTGFFRVRMLELEAPGLASELESSSVVNEYNTAKYRNYTGIKTVEQETPEQALDKACTHLFEKYKVVELKQPRIKKIITAILDNNVKLDWALRHHMRLLIPTKVESEAIQARWEKYYGKESLLTSIQSIVPQHPISDNEITGQELISRELTANEELRIKIEKSSQSDRSKRLLSEALEIMRRLCAQLKYGYEKDSQFDTECFPSFKFKQWFQILALYPAFPSPESEELENLDYEFQTLLSDRLTHAERFKESIRSPEDIIQKSSEPEKAEKHRDHYSRLSNHMRSKTRDYLISRIEQGTLEKSSLVLEFEETITYIFINPSYWLPDDSMDILSHFPTKASSSAVFARSVADIINDILNGLGAALEGLNPGLPEKKLADQIKATPDYFAHFWQAAQFATDKLDDLNDLRERVEKVRSKSPAPLLTTEELNAAFPISFSNPSLQV